MNGIRRRIHFYATTITDKAGTIIAPSDAFQELVKLVGGDNWEHKMKDARSQGIRCRTINKSSLEGQFWFDKHDHFPDVGDGIISAPLNTNGKPLRYPTHFVWWDLSSHKEIKGIPKKALGVLAMEFNIDAPRVQGFAEFLYLKSKRSLNVEISPVSEPGALERLKHTKFFKSLKIKTVDPTLSISSSTAGSMGGLDIIPETHGTESIEWVIKPGRGGALSFLRGFLPKLKRYSSAGPTVDIRITFEDGEELPLEEAPVIYTARDVPRSNDGRARSVDTAAMIEEIKNAFESKRSELSKYFGRDLG